MINIVKQDCTACGACNNICPNKSISMIPDDEGFLYPIIDQKKCINCKLCEKSCPIGNELDEKNDSQPKVYAAWSLDKKVRFNSTSGGLFTELAKTFIAQGGYVVGARYNASHLVEHHIIKEEKDIALLRQSKYVQSTIGFVFKNIKKLLEQDKHVMFVGTPCQGAGLLSFLNKDYKKLLLCDFICRGVNSPRAYLKYLESMEKHYDSTIKKVWFKNKINGWNKFCTKIEFDNGKEYYADRYTDVFMKGYLKNNLYIRPSCSNCYFKGFPRHADITLGDFWGVQLKDKKLDTDQGTSLVMIHSQKGKKHFEDLDNNIFKEEKELEEVLKFNPCAIKSIHMGEKRDYFFENIDTMDFQELINKIIGM